jgi:hypothetical protein
LKPWDLNITLFRYEYLVFPVFPSVAPPRRDGNKTYSNVKLLHNLVDLDYEEESEYCSLVDGKHVKYVAADAGVLPKDDQTFGPVLIPFATRPDRKIQRPAERRVYLAKLSFSEHTAYSTGDITGTISSFGTTSVLLSSTLRLAAT